MPWDIATSTAVSVVHAVVLVLQGQVIASRNNFVRETLIPMIPVMLRSTQLSDMAGPSLAWL